MVTQKRIALRGYLDPLDETSFSHAKSRIGRNTGNLLFSASAQRVLTTAENLIENKPLLYWRRHSERLNSEFDHFVLPLANAFRPAYLSQLRAITDIINQLTIPVTVLGVGAQAKIGSNGPENPELAEQVKLFMRAVLKRSPSIGVRGETTAAYVQKLGFSDVHVIGCPSMFMRGADLQLRTQSQAPSKRSHLALNLTPGVKVPESWVTNIAKQYPNSYFIGQDLEDIEAMFGGLKAGGRTHDYPGSLTHLLLEKNRSYVHLNALNWVRHMESFDFAFGHRIHGNIAALLAGTRAHVIAHDSRTLELAEYFEIPHTLAEDIDSDVTPEVLFEKSDWGPMISGHQQRLETFKSFLAEHRLGHSLDVPFGESDFDIQASRLEFGPQTVLHPRSDDPDSLEERLWQTSHVTQVRVEKLLAVHETLRSNYEKLSKEIKAKNESKGLGRFFDRN